MATTSRDASEKLSQAYERSKDVLGPVASETQDLYRTARTWLSDHYGTVAVLSSAAAGGGVLGYLAGRRSRSTRVRPPQQMAGAQVAHVPEIDIAPFFKFLKLWMLYRVATKD